MSQISVSVADACAAIVCGPSPGDAPDLVVTVMPLVRSNSGSSCSYAPVNPPDIRTFTARIDIFLTLATRLGRYVLSRYVPRRLYSEPLMY